MIERHKAGLIISGEDILSEHGKLVSKLYEDYKDALNESYCWKEIARGIMHAESFEWAEMQIEAKIWKL
jgi:hypothetical protein